jgi:hypothetical protein
MRPLHGHPDQAQEFQRALRAPLPGTQEAKTAAQASALAAAGLTTADVQRIMARRRQNGEPSGAGA